jgi:hypothetical protein
MHNEYTHVGEMTPLEVPEGEGSSVIPVEINVEGAPLWQIKGRNRKEGVSESRTTIATGDGQRLIQVWRVTASRDYELPGALDQDVFVAVLKLIDRQGGMSTNGKLTFSLYELVEILGRSHGGKTYDDVRESLERLATTSIHSENAFYSKDTESLETETFHLWSVRFSRNKGKRGRAIEHHTLTFHDILVRSFHAHYLKGLDTDFYFSLFSPLSRRLYRLVDQKRRDKLSWTVDLSQLRQLVSMAPSYRYPSQIKAALQPAHHELLKKGFLTEASVDKKTVRYRIGKAFAHHRATLELRGTPEEMIAVQRLISNSVWSGIARALVAQHGPDHCMYYVDALHHQKGVRNPGAWLRRYIEAGWPVHIPEEADPTSGEDLPVATSTPHPPSPEQLEKRDEHRDSKEEEHRERTREFEHRREVGEFEAAVKTFETLPYEEYAKWVGQIIRHPDGNRYYLSIDGELYVCIGGRQPEHRYYLHTLKRVAKP